MDYCKLSDDEIAEAVLLNMGFKLIDEGYSYKIFADKESRKDVGLKASKQFRFDPCNNPADAWPIIYKTGIGLRKQSNGLWCVTQQNGKSPRYDENPLRAAMIVFLMMHELNTPA